MTRWKFHFYNGLMNASLTFIHSTHDQKINRSVPSVEIYLNALGGEVYRVGIFSVSGIFIEAQRTPEVINPTFVGSRVQLKSQVRINAIILMCHRFYSRGSSARTFPHF